jgi:putative Mg2+ transporter-C (MgtC) family protein
MPVGLETAAVNLGTAVLCGALIGSERQVRQRMAGLRTNALVALGAAAFVLFSTLYPDEVSPTRVAAQIVSGIGFLGAGIIFRDGFNVHGLNTAATLWCSAAVGMMAGGGALPLAAMLTGFVVFINLGLRPLVKFLKATTKAGLPVPRQYRVMVVCASGGEAEARALMLRTLSLGGMHLSEIGRTEGREGIELTATVSGEGLLDGVVEQAVARLAAEPGLARVQWQVLDEA